MSIFFWVVVSSGVTPILVDRLGVEGCFLIFGSLTFVGCLYTHLMVKETSYEFRTVESPDGQLKRVKQTLSEKEKKFLYSPQP